MSQTADGGPPGYTSPDGRWWWDGQRWQPVHAAVQAPPVPPGPGTRVPWLVVAAVVVIGATLMALVAVAAVVALRASRSLAPPAGPASGHYLAAASVSGIEGAATSHGLRCGTALAVGVGAPSIHTCQGMSGGELRSVEMIGPDTGHVSVVTADVLRMRPADEPAALDLLQAVVAAAVPGEDAADAASWVRAHFDQQGPSQTVVDGVVLRLTVTSSVRSLVVQPARS